MVTQSTERRNRPTPRLTTHMKFVEYRFKKPLADIILNSLAENDCHNHDAADAIGINPSTLSRWIRQLGLVELVEAMRNQVANPNSDEGKRLKRARKQYREIKIREASESS